VASFLGIIPVSKDSDKVKRRGRLSKDGPSTARWTLGIMVDTVKRRNPHIKRCYDRAKKRKGRALSPRSTCSRQRYTEPSGESVFISLLH
jgi:transposase